MKLVLCDDHGLLVEALQCALEAGGHVVVSTALTPEDGVRAVEEHAPDACLLDLNFPDGSALDALLRMRVACSRTRVLILSASSDGALLGHAIARGASGVLRKDQPVEVILRALQDLERSGAATGPKPVPVRKPSLPEPGSARWLLQFLTERERDVLQRILDGESTAQMAAAMHVSRSTARTHVQNVLFKLGVHSRLQAAALVAGVADCGAQR